MLCREVEVSTNELIHITEHGHCYINPYYGCSEGCPFCYWNDIPGWAGKIDVRINAPEVLDKYLNVRKHEEMIYLGSYCNPYETVESKYRITRSILQVLKAHKVPFALMTSASMIIDDLPLFREMQTQATIVFELSRIRRMKTFNMTGHHDVIEAANTLNNAGIRTMATLSPYLFGITDLERVRTALAEDIPLYVGALDVVENTPMYQRFVDCIAEEAPELTNHYVRLIHEESAEQELSEVLSRIDSSNIRRFPLELE